MWELNRVLIVVRRNLQYDVRTVTISDKERKKKKRYAVGLVRQPLIDTGSLCSKGEQARYSNLRGISAVIFISQVRERDLNDGTGKERRFCQHFQSLNVELVYLAKLSNEMTRKRSSAPSVYHR